MLAPDPLLREQLAWPFEDPERIYEIKHDGFRALALIERGAYRLTGSWSREFGRGRAKEVNVENAVLCDVAPSHERAMEQERIWQ